MWLSCMLRRKGKGVLEKLCSSSSTNSKGVSSLLRFHVIFFLIYLAGLCLKLQYVGSSFLTRD